MFKKYYVKWIAALVAGVLLLAGCSAPASDTGAEEEEPEEAEEAAEEAEEEVVEDAAVAAVQGPLPCSIDLTIDDVVNYQVPEADEPYNIALLQVSLQGYYYVGIAYGAFDAAEEAGVNLEMVAASGYASPEQQLQQMEDILQSDVDAIVMAPSDIFGSVPVVEAAIEAGIPVVNISTEVASSDVVQVMQDDYLMGQIAADRVAELVGDEGGKGVIIGGPDRATWSQKRTQGFLDQVAAEHPNVEVAAVTNQLVDPAEGLADFEDSVQADPDIDWVYSVHSYILPAQSLPPEYQGEIFYVTNGLEPDSQSALENGWIDTIYGIAPVPMGYMGVGKAIEILNGDEQPSYICVPTPVFTQDNIAEAPVQIDLFPDGWEPPQ